MAMTRRLLPALVLALAAIGVQAQDKFITMASTTSTDQSGLFGHLLPVFKQASGIDVRVNIVGLAIDELMLRETFQQWARIGHGQYLDAKNSQELLRSRKTLAIAMCRSSSQKEHAQMLRSVNGPWRS